MVHPARCFSCTNSPGQKGAISSSLFGPGSHHCCHILFAIRKEQHLIILIINTITSEFGLFFMKYVWSKLFKLIKESFPIRFDIFLNMTTATLLCILTWCFPLSDDFNRHDKTITHDKRCSLSCQEKPNQIKRNKLIKTSLSDSQESAWEHGEASHRQPPLRKNSCLYLIKTNKQGV